MMWTTRDKRYVERLVLDDEHNCQGRSQGGPGVPVTPP